MHDVKFIEKTLIFYNVIASLTYQKTYTTEVAVVP